MLDYDLHCHSNISDGTLSPTELITRAAGRGVKVLALTDHDDVAGLAEARVVANSLGVTLINGVEVSVTWRGHSVHIVGLLIDPDNEVLQQGLATVRSGRGVRAQKMAEALEKAGVRNALAGAYEYANNPNMIGRTHFARYLVEKGYCKDVKSVFNRFLATGKPGYVSHEWASLDDAVAWIHASGGLAVIAHPGRYMTGKKCMGRPTMRALLTEFKELGGQGVEVVTGSHTQEQYAQFARYAREFDLLASCGSDFHSPEESFRDLGRLPDLPLDCVPIWHNWTM